MHWIQNVDDKPAALMNIMTTLSRHYRYPEGRLVKGLPQVPAGGRFTQDELIRMGLCGIYFDNTIKEETNDET